MQAIGGYGRTALGAGALHGWQVRHLDPVERVLRLAKKPYLARHVTHMLWPGCPGRSPYNRHYLYIPGVGWTAIYSTITGTMEATGVVTGGTFSYLAPVGTVETYQITWANGGSPVVSFCIGFNRALTAAERTALGQAAFWAQLFAGTAIVVGDCTGETGEALTVDGTVITVDGGVVTVEA